MDMEIPFRRTIFEWTATVPSVMLARNIMSDIADIDTEDMLIEKVVGIRKIMKFVIQKIRVKVM